jgi:stage V sporulation protein D (sporulation-specific penicillin-binding protein)
LIQEKFEKKLKGKKITKRILLVFYFIFWSSALLSFRLFQLQVFEGGKFKRLARDEHVEKIKIHALRGKIFDRYGKLLALSVPGYSVAAYPSKIKHVLKTANLLAAALNIPVNLILSRLRTSSGFVWIRRKIYPAKVDLVKKLMLPGIEVIRDSTGKRIYPLGDLACSVLGFTGIDDQGLDGVEMFYNNILEGKGGYIEAETDELGRILPDGKMKIVPPVPGADLILTISSRIQYEAQEALKKCVLFHHAKNGTIIVMNPNNGEILALANYPEYNPNQYWKYPLSSLNNLAISDLYEPGSTGKLFTAAAALNSGKITMSEKFLAHPYIDVDGWRIHNASDGLEPLTPMHTIKKIIQDSLNVGAASIALKIGKKTFYHMLDKFGLNQLTGIDLPGEAYCLIRNYKTVRKIDLATMAYGQGIAITPIQLARAYSIVANGGYLIHPHVLKEAVFPNGTIFKTPDKKGPRILNKKTDKDLKYLFSLVIKKGTGTMAQMKYYSAAGKTGTGSIAKNGVYLHGKYTASFIGFVPVKHPKIVILVKITEPRYPYWGGTVAAPVWKSLVEKTLWYLGVPPTKGGIKISLNN